MPLPVCVQSQQAEALHSTSSGKVPVYINYGKDSGPVYRIGDLCRNFCLNLLVRHFQIVRNQDIKDQVVVAGSAHQPDIMNAAPFVN